MPVRHNIDSSFSQLQNFLSIQVPQIVLQTAQESFKQNFNKKSFDGNLWPETKKPVKKGTLMVRSRALLNSVRGTVVSSSLVRMIAGSPEVPYARIHNEGGKISRAARSETFTRNRAKAGKRKGQFRKGTSDGQGFSFKAYSYNMPQRQFMGPSAQLSKEIKDNIAAAFKNLK